MKLVRLKRSLVAIALLGTAALHAEGLSPELSAVLAKAEAGDPSAQFRLGSAYDTGRGAPRDGKQAMRWYLAAAEQGNAEAQNSVGSGLQSEKRFAEALPWYDRASAQNHALATNNLAYLYDQGLGVAQDRQRAFALYSKAADLGLAEAMWNIANMYGAGQLGAPPDLLAACVWALRARQNAGTNERPVLAQVARVVPMLERKLFAEQMASCREQSAAWSPPAASSRIDLPRRED